ncbi:MAG: thioredoxin domain-containing protein [Synergistaceae bacterium]|nr:thioredoxin domain-containing protein [Synergistaceae bacterium]MBQ9575162.1 thioredoxin domain-containing protein [Synergistaceae bacterium]
MPISNGLMNDLGPLAAYGEYTEEVYSPSSQPLYKSPSKSTEKKRKPFVPVNHLSTEASPYLLQHADNPVGWFAWGDEAFETARSEDKPIFLSIGYSSDHWCHVMERECFNDVEVAGMMNDTCIPVKVDREERPDLDNIYMEICRVQNGSAGWPLNIFMTPEGRPFFCTTWLPKRTAGQMPGITELLPRVKWLWHMQRDDVERAADDLASAVKERFSILSGSKNRSGGRIGRFTAYEALNDIRSIFDVRWGGFGGSPKFPEHNKLLFLLSQAQEGSEASKRDKSDAITMTDVTLRRMWRGGIHDHLGGGFSRYSVDEQWLVPHFEKLLCDQAMLLMAVSISQRLIQNSFHRLFAEDIIFCITKDFSDGNSFSQGFRTSVDGDTPEGEGRYYLWNENEIKRLLPEGDSGLFCAAYAVLPSGNFGSELAGSQMSWNILYEASTVTELARRYGIKGAEVGQRLYEARKILLDARDKRYPLRSDNKVLMSWNGLMIAALAHASVSFEQTEWKDIAERSALFIQKNFADRNGNWYRRWIDGKIEIPALAEDYVYFLWGIIELYRASEHFKAGERQLEEWVKTAKILADTLIEKFGDEKNGGLFETAGDDRNISLRLKTAEDINSLPSVNAVAAIVLTELAFIAEDKKYSDFARKIIGCFSGYARENPLSCLSLITADLMWRPFKPKRKPEPEPKPILTDEELNREEPEIPQQQEDRKEEHRASRASRRSARQESGTSGSAASGTSGKGDRASRRSARTHRASSRER